MGPKRSSIGRCRPNTSDRATDPRHRKSPAHAHDQSFCTPQAVVREANRRVMLLREHGGSREDPQGLEVATNGAHRIGPSSLPLQGHVPVGPVPAAAGTARDELRPRRRGAFDPGGRPPHPRSCPAVLRPGCGLLRPPPRSTQTRQQARPTASSPTTSPSNPWRVRSGQKAFQHSTLQDLAPWPSKDDPSDLTHRCWSRVSTHARTRLQATAPGPPAPG